MVHKPILKTTDRMIWRYAYYKPLTVKFPDKCEWQNVFTPNIKLGLVWYVDRSKTSKGSGSGYIDGAQEGSRASALGSKPLYSRLKYMPLRHV
jgi:hypothetical protein